jgi:DNA polymerase-3 subunit epsilon
VEGHRLLWKLVREWKLCPKLCFLQADEGPCEGIREEYCGGACSHVESPQAYNLRVSGAIEWLGASLPTFSVLDQGRNPEERSVILVEKGRFYGMGYLPSGQMIPSAAGELKNYLTAYPENDYMRGLVFQHVERWPYKKNEFI